MPKLKRILALLRYILRPLSPGGFSIPSRRLTTAAVSLLFLFLTLPLFSFTRAYNAHDTHTRTYASLSAPTQVSVASRAGAGLGAALRSLFTPAKAVAATSDTLNFQARLQTAGGAIVPDGYYDIQFKLYSVSTGGTALWTETYAYNSGSGACSGPVGTNDCRVRVVNGYVSVYLGSQTAFPTTIPWDQQLYLTMNVGGTTSSGTITYDGEMTPRLKLTAVPYAMQAKQASQLATSNGGNLATLAIQAPTVGNQTFQIQDQGAAGTYNILTAPNGSDGYIKLQTTTPGTQQTGNFNISGTGKAGTNLIAPLIQSADGAATNDLVIRSGNNSAGTAGNVTIDTGTSTSGSSTISLGITNATNINIGTNANCHYFAGRG